MDAIEKAKITTEVLGIQVELEIDYPEFEKLKYYSEKNGVQIVDTKYENTIKCYINIKKELLDSLISENKIINYKIIKEINIRLDFSSK
jgi:putative IMPACT (imprinted ancient) family translation regulator